MEKRGRGMREGQQWRARLGSGQYASRRASIPPCLEVRITSHGQLTVDRGQRAPRTRVGGAGSVRPRPVHAAALCASVRVRRERAIQARSEVP